MALDRWVAFVILCAALAYGYAAFFTMDASLPPFMQRNPIWPSTFPKVLCVMAVLTSLFILLGFEKAPESGKKPDIDYRRLGDYHLTHALLLIGLMVAYALCLRPLGFLFSTFAFLAIGAFVLGERKFHILVPVAALASGTVWYLVDQVLGIFLSPWPMFF